MKIRKIKRDPIAKSLSDGMYQHKIEASKKAYSRSKEKEKCYDALKDDGELYEVVERR